MSHAVHGGVDEAVLQLPVVPGGVVQRQLAGVQPGHLLQQLLAAGQQLRVLAGSCRGEGGGMRLEVGEDGGLEHLVLYHVLYVL